MAAPSCIPLRADLTFCRDGAIGDLRDRRLRYTFFMLPILGLFAALVAIGVLCAFVMRSSWPAWGAILAGLAATGLGASFDPARGAIVFLAAWLGAHLLRELYYRDRWPFGPDRLTRS